MDYMLDKIMDASHSKFVRYELRAEAEWNSNFYMNEGGQRLETVKEKAQEMIYMHMDSIDELLQKIIAERIKSGQLK